MYTQYTHIHMHKADGIDIVRHTVLWAPQRVASHLMRSGLSGEDCFSSYSIASYGLLQPCCVMILSLYKQSFTQLSWYIAFNSSSFLLSPSFVPLSSRSLPQEGCGKHNVCVWERERERRRGKEDFLFSVSRALCVYLSDSDCVAVVNTFSVEIVEGDCAEGNGDGMRNPNEIDMKLLSIPHRSVYGESVYVKRRSDRWICLSGFLFVTFAVVCLSANRFVCTFALIRLFANLANRSVCTFTLIRLSANLANWSVCTFALVRLSANPIRSVVVGKSQRALHFWTSSP